MLTKLVLITNLALNYTVDERAESLKVPFMSTTVGESVPAAVLYAPVIACDSLIVTKNTPIDTLIHCAVGRPGWIKL
jgi:hypothetical protein